jgi:hypothetical protein
MFLATVLSVEVGSERHNAKQKLSSRKFNIRTFVCAFAWAWGCMLISSLSSPAACSLQYILHPDSAAKSTLLIPRSKSVRRPSALVRLDLSSSSKQNSVEMAETTATAPDVPDNAPKGDLFITSKRGEIVHLRCYVPEDPASIKAVLFFFHGYTGHSSSLPKRTLAKVGFLRLRVHVSFLQLDLQKLCKLYHSMTC